MQLKTDTRKTLNHLVHLPALAEFILTRHLRDYVTMQLSLSREMDIPLLKAFRQFSDEELMEMSLKSSSEYLTYLAENKAEQQINTSIANWISNRLPQMDKYDVLAEDITLISYIRKQGFLHFIPAFCGNTENVFELLKEIDLFILESETRLTNVYIRLLKDNIEYHSHFIEKINNTTPSAIYVFDVDKFEGIYSNNKLGEIIGYDQGELNRIGTNAIEKLIHPDDQPLLRINLEKLLVAKDGETISYNYRIKNKEGNYRWVRNYESVFKRHSDGRVWQTIGITLDIDNEQKTTEALNAREQQLLEAQDIAELGSYFWDFENRKSTGSPKTFEILEIEKNAFSTFLQKIHPEDKDKVEEEFQKSLKTGVFDCEFRMFGETKEKVIWSRGVINYANDKPVGLTGTVMDVTKRHKILQELNQSDARYKQAEAITHIGNYVWDLKKNTIKWSDELFRIYGLDPLKDEINFSVVESFNHPEDIPMVQEQIQKAIAEQRNFNFYYRIHAKNGSLKILHAQGEIIKDEDGMPDTILGTTQDVTEKQNLISQLRLTESIYKQAEELANMGNWTWDLVTNKLEWTDQLYKIYGMQPQSEKITYEKFLSIVHPDDREYVQSKARAIFIEQLIDYSFRIQIADGTVKTIRSIAQIREYKNGEPIFIIGTERDITEKQNLIDRLKQSEVLFKQAQSLARLGNWSYDILTKNFEWSEEMYRIYGLPTDTSVSLDLVNGFIHPEDKESVRNYFNYCIEHLVPYDKHHRIVLKDGRVKTIHRKGTFVLDIHNNAVKLTGTTQDVTDRQQLIERLEKSEQLYKQAQRIAHIGNWSYELKSKKAIWSTEMFEIYEIHDKPVDTSYEVFFDKILVEDQPMVRKNLREAIASHKDFEFNHSIIAGGKQKILSVKGQVISDNFGNAVQLVGTSQDVTQQYKIERELRDNQTFIQKITDATPSIIASYNINTGKYVFLSEGIEKLLGYNKDEGIKQGAEFFAGIIHPEDLPGLMEKNRKALEEANASVQENDPVVEFTYRMRHKNGNYRWFHTYGTIFDRNPKGHVEHVLNISLDITEQIKATETIKEQEHFIKQIADASPTILYLFDVETQSIAYINREIFFVLGYLPEEIISAGEEFTGAIYHPEDYPLLPERKLSEKKFQQVDSMIQYECRMKNKEGEWRWVLVREIVFKTDDDGNIIQILGAALDINRRKDMEKTILHNTLLLEQSNASLEEFAYVASHDLKEPLRKISTFGDRLVATQSESLSNEGQLYLQKIVDASQRMQTMISDILSISMISGNTSFEKFSLQRILDETLQTLEYKIEQQKAIIKSTSLPDANIIPSQFRQLFQNLLSNSLKFMRPGVQPEITIKHSYLNNTEVAQYQLAEAARYHKLEFKDNGIGFENEYAGKIFAIFQRLHGRSEYEGSGIGLAICKKIVEHHDGIIYAYGIPNEGATFTILLPV